MLQTIRDKSQGVITWIIIMAICLSFALWGIGNYFTGGAQQKTVAQVNGEQVTLSEFTNAYHLLLEEQRASAEGSLLTSLDQPQLQQLVLSELIRNKVFLSSAKKQGFYITAQEVTQSLKKIPGFTVNNQLDLNRLEQAIKQSGLSHNQFINQIKSQLLLQQVKQSITDTSFVLPVEAKKLLSLLKQQRDIEYLVIDYEKLIAEAKKHQFSEEEINNYYHSHLQNFEIPSQISLAYVELSAKDFYNEFKASLPEAEAKKQADKRFYDVSEQLADLSYENPDSLDELSRTLNLPIKTTKKFSKDNVGTDAILQYPAVQRAAFSEEVISEHYNSDLITLELNRVVVLRVADHKPARVKSLKEVKAEVISELQVAKAKHMAITLGDTIMAKVKEGKQIKRLADDYKLSIHSKKGVVRSAEDINRSILQAAFTLPRSQSGKQTAAKGIVLPNGNYVVVLVRNICDVAEVAIKDEEIAQFQQQMVENIGLIEFELYQQSMMQQASVKKKRLSTRSDDVS